MTTNTTTGRCSKCGGQLEPTVHRMLGVTYYCPACKTFDKTGGRA